MYSQIPFMMPSYAAPVAQAATTGTKVASLFSKLNLGSILTNTQKTLNVVNQAIPLYYQVKPVFKNFKTIGKIGKELSRMNNAATTNNVNTSTNINTNTTNTTSQFESNTSEVKQENNIPNPSFFL